mmetsp:Transcript_34726/g.68995  ORF Transcript_34726/g.68995 Transcript_34726/m.68995 type:complete len:162 (-) Transcript_34726:444-929(-)
MENTDKPLEPTRLAVRFDPPTICLACPLLNGRHRRHNVHLKGLSAKQNPETVAKTLIAKHANFFGNLDGRQITRLVKMLIDNIPEPKLVAAGIVATAGRTLKIDMELLDDLQTVDEVVLKAAKGKMDETFEKNLVLVGHADYEYDKQVDFGEGEEETSWDE